MHLKKKKKNPKTILEGQPQVQEGDTEIQQQKLFLGACKWDQGKAASRDCSSELKISASPHWAHWAHSFIHWLTHQSSHKHLWSTFWALVEPWNIGVKDQTLTLEKVIVKL